MYVPGAARTPLGSSPSSSSDRGGREPTAGLMRDRVAIAGIGYTPLTRDSGVSTLTLGCRAILAAIEDAGLRPDEVDGLATHRVGDSVLPGVLAQALGIRDLRWYADQFGGGSSSCAIVGQAALAVYAGLADAVVCYRAINARSEFRMGGIGRPPGRASGWCASPRST